MRNYQRLSERECRAIRCGVGPFGDAEYDVVTMSVRFRDARGDVSIPAYEVRDYLDAWRRSGLWSLKGRDDIST